MENVLLQRKVFDHAKIPSTVGGNTAPCTPRAPRAKVIQQRMPQAVYNQCTTLLINRKPPYQHTSRCERGHDPTIALALASSAHAAFDSTLLRELASFAASLVGPIFSAHMTSCLLARNNTSAGSAAGRSPAPPFACRREPNTIQTHRSYHTTQFTPQLRHAAASRPAGPGRTETQLLPPTG